MGSGNDAFLVVDKVRVAASFVLQSAVVFTRASALLRPPVTFFIQLAGARALVERLVIQYNTLML